jgi:two-component system, chemotaxis family, CheB/CheR fusion protein
LACAPVMKRSAKSKKNGFPIVGIGSSAGGLEALKLFFQNVAPDSNMAYISVSHLIPNKRSMMTSILQQFTSLPVNDIEDGVTVQPDHVYVVTPNRLVSVHHGHLYLREPVSRIVTQHPIDQFLLSLAGDQGEKAIAVILSGSGSEGAQGIEAIKEHGGFVAVQSPKTAIHDSMPQQSLATGLADIELPPDKIPEKIYKYWQTWRLFSHAPPVKTLPMADYNKIFSLINDEMGYDFSTYKRTTIYRRIQRRISVQQLDSTKEYVRYLERNPCEVQKLFKELLIGVTGFFRDREEFDYLKTAIIPSLFAGKTKRDALRVWVPGCATGEEAYSIAMIILDVLQRKEMTVPFHIFATDIDKEAIDKARGGVFPEPSADNIPEPFSSKYVTAFENRIKIKPAVRDTVIFSVQNVLGDPPFSKLDLISCRNLLIYLESNSQQRLLEIFHYALRPGGILFLGAAESVGENIDLFKLINKKHKFFQRKNVISVPGQISKFSVGFMKPHKATETSAKPFIPPLEVESKQVDVMKAAKDLILRDYSPTAIIIEKNGDVKYSFGAIEKYLAFSSGRTSLNINDIAREGLGLMISSSLRNVMKEKKTVTLKNVQYKSEGATSFVDISVKPFFKPHPLQDLFLVVFTEPQKTEITMKAQGPLRADTHNDQIRYLETELRDAKENLRKQIEEMQGSNEELQSTNEELQSANEELQSANEELETYREEQQSINEELETVNSKLKMKNDEYQRISQEVENLMSNTKVATLFLDTNLVIKRFTPEMTKIMHLIDTDIGRPITDLAPHPFTEGIAADAKKVLETLSPIEEEIQDAHGNWYIKRILPYRTTENIIAGVVLTIVDIALRKQLEKTLDEKTEKYSMIFNKARDGIALVERETGQIVDANHSFEKLTGRSLGQMKTMKIWEIMVPEDMTLARKAFTTGQDIGIAKPNRFRIQQPSGTSVTIILVTTEIQQKTVTYYLILARSEDTRKNQKNLES